MKILQQFMAVLCAEVNSVNQEAELVYRRKSFNSTLGLIEFTAGYYSRQVTGSSVEVLAAHCLSQDVLHRHYEKLETENYFKEFIEGNCKTSKLYQ